MGEGDLDLKSRAFCFLTVIIRACFRGIIFGSGFGGGIGGSLLVGGFGGTGSGNAARFRDIMARQVRLIGSLNVSPGHLH